MARPTMTKFATIAIVLLAGTVSRSQRILRDNDPWNWKLNERRARSAGTVDEDIREIFRRISNGASNEKDDEELVNLVKNEIIETARKIKTPAGSIEAAAQRAQRMVSELTAAYTTAIYKSKSTSDARMNFGRFQNVVQEIVDFIKNGQFVEQDFSP